MSKIGLVAVVGLMWVTPGVSGQSLFVQAPPPPIPGSGVQAAGTLLQPGLSLQQTSLLAIEPPKPRQYRKHDLVTIIVDEVSRQEAEQNLKTDKNYGLDAQLNAVLDPMELLEARLRQADIERLRLIDAASKQRFDGKGKFQRNDRFTTKLQAEIIDVKPNGVLVLEAKRTTEMGEEKKTTVLSGICRAEDITANNTVFSSQIANMMLVTRHEGQVEKAGSKGLIPRVLETVFAF
jgi:flagellar L-ring protein FlgH